jgi:hypothetical protein
VEVLQSRLDQALGIALGEHLRSAQALAVLEHIGTAAAGEVLAKLAAGAPEARLTREAKDSLERLRRRGVVP